MVIVSWNTLPGDRLYPVKLILENVAIMLTSPSEVTRASLSVKFSERRFSEAARLFGSKQSILGLTYAIDQIGKTADIIAQTKDNKTRSDAASSYIATLETMQYQLEQQKEQIGEESGIPHKPTGYQKVKIPTSIAKFMFSGALKSTPKKSYRRTSPPSDTSTTTTQSSTATTPAQTIEAIEHTQQVIQETITELEQVSSQSTAPIPTPTPFPTAVPIPTVTPTPMSILLSPTAGGAQIAGQEGAAAASTTGPMAAPRISIVQPTTALTPTIASTSKPTVTPTLMSTISEEPTSTPTQ